MTPTPASPTPAPRPSIGRAGALPSFRLRTTSLNALRLRRIFDRFDFNGDGLLTPAELGRALHRLGLEADPADLDLTLAAYTKPGAGGLEFDDFEGLHRALGDAIFGAGGEASVEEEESDLNEAFKVFDEDGDGYISAVELQAVLGKLGLPEGREMEDVRKMICKVDENRDGLVDFVEFKHMMLQNVVPVRSA